ncbi:MAG: SDR family oxidoreductase [Acidimicrobiales bacterium]|nr:SDR family oxidoreductase [Acidimicrobiales bacterium]RZV47232.1 MAG: SDR family oxidoreductase [Acidimicrobiales bacterium]
MNVSNVIVTGAAQGIGKAVAVTLAADPTMSLLLADIQSDKVAEVAAELGATSTQVDIASPESCQDMVQVAVDRLGGLDAVVQVAGLDAPAGTAKDTHPDLWRRVIDIDLSGPWWVAKSAVDHMVQHGGGRIVIVSSVSAHVPSDGTTPAYNAAKAGLHGLVVAMAHQLEGDGILVNAIAPGATGTGQPLTNDERTMLEEIFPLGLGGPQPVADMASFLLGPGGDWVSGAIFNVSGGMHKGR